MRTTLTLDDDVAATLQRLRKERHVALRDLVNEALRVGLKQIAEPAKPRPRFEGPTANLGKCLVGDIVNASEVIDRVEGPWHR
jgi:hypothetical protein